MRTAHSVRALSALAILALAVACSSDGTGPATSGEGTLAVAPSTSTIGAGHVLQLTASIVDEFGEPLTGVNFSWSTTNPAVATVSVSGTVFGRSAGRTAIRASARGRTVTAAVQVVQPEPDEPPSGKPRPAL
jgi:uncharacterized protein YjdB